MVQVERFGRHRRIPVRAMKRISSACFGILACLAATLGSAYAATKSPNILLICIDDLRPEIGSYGADYVHSPNMDRLAASGVTFDRCYVQVAVCNPSRASTWTGIRPDRLGVYTLRTHFREAMPEAVTLPQQLRQHGYVAHGFGKIFHNPWQDPQSWDVPHTWGSGNHTHYTPEQQKLRQEVQAQLPKDAWQKGNLRGVITNDPDITDAEHPDGSMARKAIERMKELCAGDKPFFVAAGFILPHLPWAPPKSWWDRYDRGKLPLPANPYPPEGAPEVAVGTNYELSHYADMVNMPTPFSGSLPEAEIRRLRHAYFASVSFVDAQVGLMLDALDELGIADNTVVILWSDHGWKLGEHNGWSKMTNYEIDARIPMIIRDPRAKANGRHTSRLVESLDLYPTICELAGVPVPEGVDGRSLVPLLNDPEAPHIDAAFSQYVRDGLLGNAIRTDRWRYVEWRTLAEGELKFRELYDEDLDPQENRNVVDHYPLVGVRLAKRMARTLTTGPVNMRAQIHSEPGGERLKIQFINDYEGPVRITWISPQGHRRNSWDVAPGATRDMGTFVGHAFAVESLDGKYHEVRRIQAGDGEVRLGTK